MSVDGNNQKRETRAVEVTHVFPVRGRPVGFQAGRWGGALVAVERGYFPVSPTGYRSLSGLGLDHVSAEMAESLAGEQDRERRSLVKCLREATRPGHDRLGNFIHASLTWEKAFNDGFFAPEPERAELWFGAHRLLQRVDADARFQPVPTMPAWTERHCAAAMEKMRALRRLLEQCARGDFPAEMPVPHFGARAYLALPAKPRGETVAALAGAEVELALDLAPGGDVGPEPRPGRARTSGVPAENRPAHTQLGLFEAGNIGAVASARAPARHGLAPGV